MTVLAALNAYYDRLADKKEAPPFGYSTEGIGFCIVLRADGTVSAISDLRDFTTKKRLPLPIPVPQSFKRPGVTPRSFWLWDNSKFVLGVGKDKATGEITRFDAHNLSFRERHEKSLAGTEDAGLLALLKFVLAWTPEQFRPDLFPEAMLDQNIVFALEDDWRGQNRTYLHDRHAARALWQRELASAAGEKKSCLVTGEPAPISRLHPAIKGVWGAQSSGASLVSFNLDAFESYGKPQGDNAPVSESAAFGYGTALNKLLARDSRQRMQIGDASVVFWADASRCGEAAARLTEELAAGAIDPSRYAHQDDDEDDPPDDKEEETRLRHALEQVAAGRPVKEIDPGLDPETRFYVLGLAPNAARLSVRFWHEMTIGPFVETIAAHWRDMRIEPSPWRGQPAAWALLYETAVQRKAENIPPRLGGELMRAILTGSRYPRTLLSATLQRIRADGDINGARAAICKACLARDARVNRINEQDEHQEDKLVSLDRSQTDSAYRLGRLFAVLENVQYSAMGKVNANIRDRYFAAASATPASVFPLLLRGANNHLSVLRKKNKAGFFEREMSEIVDGLPMSLPRHFRLEDQGRFVVGYYHQRNARKADAEASPAESIPTE